MADPIRGNIVKVYITPPSTTFPWIKVSKHPEGIRAPGQEVASLNASPDRERLVRDLGEAVLEGSEILQAWLAAAP